MKLVEAMGKVDNVYLGSLGDRDLDLGSAWPRGIHFREVALE